MLYDSDIVLKPRTKNLLGQPFGRLTVIAFAGYLPYPTDDRKEAFWRCECHEGNIVLVKASSLIRNLTQSCGCLNKERTKAAATIHGRHRTSIYHVWSNMIQRCHTPTNPAYPNYGGRGITVCKPWHTFASFYADMGDLPSPRHTLERRDNNKGYNPENCLWVTRSEQSRNTRQNVMLTHDDITQCLEDWAKQQHMSSDTLRSRLKRGWSLTEALTRPLRQVRYRKHNHMAL